MNRFAYVQPKNLEDALVKLSDAKHPLVPKGGGVDLIGIMKDRLDAPSALLNLLPLAELREIKEENGFIRVGSLATLAEIGANVLLKTNCKAFSDSALEAATPQIRNQATVAGNLLQRPHCWYFRHPDFACLKKGGTECFAIEGRNDYHSIYGNDTCAIVHPSNMATPLMALDGIILLRNAKDVKEREISTVDFFNTKDIREENILAKDEIITALKLPKGRVSVYIELREKMSFDWPLCGVAVSCNIENQKFRDWRIVLGAVAPKPWRMEDAEKRMEGIAIDDERALKKMAAENAKLIADKAKPLSRNAYKVTLIKTLVERAILKLAQK